MNYPWNKIYKITTYKSTKPGKGSVRISTIKTKDGFETAYMEDDEAFLKVDQFGLHEAAGADFALCSLVERIMEVEGVEYEKSTLYGDWARKKEEEDERNGQKQDSQGDNPSLSRH